MYKNGHLDLKLINGYLETLNISVLQQMLELYIKQSQVYLLEIETAVSQENQNSWQEQCHKMKGSAASAGLTIVYEKLKVIEKSTESWLIKNTEMKDLTLLNQEAIEAFKQWLSVQ